MGENKFQLDMDALVTEGIRQMREQKRQHDLKETITWGYGEVTIHDIRDLLDMGYSVGVLAPGRELDNFIGPQRVYLVHVWESDKPQVKGVLSRDWQLAGTKVCPCCKRSLESE